MTPALSILLAIGTETRHGYAIMREIRDATGGRVEILPGTLYATIKTLLADGLIEEVPPPKDADSSDGRRRYYRVTRAGRASAAAQTEQMAVLVKLGRPFLKTTR
jgi:DNA-binding PadR family transcriptional regulator